MTQEKMIAINQFNKNRSCIEIIEPVWPMVKIDGFNKNRSCIEISLQ